MVPGPISIVVTTYERPDALDAVLHSLAAQTDRDFEIVIADDGSGAATAALIDSWKPRIGLPLSHVWHEDRGFRAAEIRNRAVLATKGSYCIFLDGDCIAQRDFVAAHRKFAEPGWFVTGNRALLSQRLTDLVLRRKLHPEDWALADWLGHRSTGGVNRLAPVLHVPLGPLRKVRAKAWQGARSCNLAVWRTDLDRVDGFDAAFSGWGREDSDLLVRLLHAGSRRKDGTLATGVLHLWHHEADRSELSKNDARLNAVIDSQRVRAERGMSALEPAPSAPLVTEGQAD